MGDYVKKIFKALKRMRDYVKTEFQSFKGSFRKSAGKKSFRLPFHDDKKAAPPNEKCFIVKVGTDVLMQNNGDSLDENVMQNIAHCLDDASLKAILVTSGAVACGRMLRKDKLLNGSGEVEQKRLLAAIGNPLLFQTWQRFFKNKRVLQGLITQDFLATQKAEKDLLPLLITSLESKDIIPVINENDLLSDEELKIIRGGEFGDNDKTAALLARLFSSKYSITLIYLTSSPGVLDEKGERIPVLNIGELGENELRRMCNGKSAHGFGGMMNKIKVIKELVEAYPSVCVYILPGKDVEQLKKLLVGDVDVPEEGTKVATCRDQAKVQN